VDETVHFHLGKVIKCDFKPGSVERSVRSTSKGVYLSSQLHAILSISATNKQLSNFPVAIKTHSPFFKFDSVKGVLEV
jgi:hypothetical protein